MTEVIEKTSKDLSITGEFQALPKRKIREETCQHWGYRVGEHGGKVAQLAYYFDPDTRKPVACKVRYPDKTFCITGDPSKMTLYGQWLWRDGGKMVVVTEGEIDALSVSQIQNNKYPVVSVPNGAKAALQACKKAYEWLSRFDTIVFMFDNDEHGIAAAKQCAELFPKKAKIASLPLKDANDCLVAGRANDIIDCMWGAKAYRPDGIVDGTQLWDQLTNHTVVPSLPYPWDGLNGKTHGLRVSELVTICAGSGIGKSAIVRTIAHSLIKQGETVGMIMLEESTTRTALGLMGIELQKALHTGSEATKEELETAFLNTLGTGRVYLYDHFGSTEVDNLLNRIRYMAVSLDCRWIILDHLSIVVSGLAASGDERQLIDSAMTSLRTLVQETGIGLILVSHLKRPEGKGHEEGAKTSLSQLRGSHAIAQLSDIVLGAERDQQGENPNETTLRVLKNRFSGETGEACALLYDKVTGCLTEQASMEF